MSVPRIDTSEYHGGKSFDLSRYVLLHLTQVGWVAAGVYLLSNAYWPSSCRPDSLVEIFRCSFRLPESRHWVEAALLTWLWATPILVLFDIVRRYRSWADRRT